MDNLKTRINAKINSQIPMLASQIADLQYHKQPQFWKPYGDKDREISVKDAEYHIPFLTEAIIHNDINIFTDYVVWVKNLFRGLNIPDEDIIVTLECTQEVLMWAMPKEDHPILSRFIEAGIKQMHLPTLTNNSFIDEKSHYGIIARDYIGFLLKGNRHAASMLIMEDEFGIQIIGLSVAMPYHLSLLEQTISEIRHSESGKRVKILIGGNSLNARPQLWEKFIADGFAPNANEAVILADRLIA